jgi:hypothetical protein
MPDSLHGQCRQSYVPDFALTAAAEALAADPQIAMLVEHRYFKTLALRAIFPAREGVIEAFLNAYVDTIDAGDMTDDDALAEMDVIAKLRTFSEERW